MRYKVVGKFHKVFGKSHGEHFERNIPEAQERTLIGGGFIVRAPKKNKQEPSFAETFANPALVGTESKADEVPAEQVEQTDAPTEGAETEPPEGMSSSV